MYQECAKGEEVEETNTSENIDAAHKTMEADRDDNEVDILTSKVNPVQVEDNREEIVFSLDNTSEYVSMELTSESVNDFENKDHLHRLRKGLLNIDVMHVFRRQLDRLGHSTPVFLPESIFILRQKARNFVANFADKTSILLLIYGTSL